MSGAGRDTDHKMPQWNKVVTSLIISSIAIGCASESDAKNIVKGMEN